MKKTIIAILLLSTMLVSCGISKAKIYDVKLTSYIEGGIFKDSVEVYHDKESNETIQEPIASVVKLGKSEIDVNLISKRHYTYKPQQNVYLSKDKNTEYTMSEDSTFWCMRAINNSVLSSLTNESLTEDELIKYIQDFMSSYIDIGILDGYVYSCSTGVTVKKSDAAWRETKSTFWIPQNDTEQVSLYQVEYQKYCDNIPTSDRILVICNNRGDIIGFYFYQYDTDWNNSKFDESQIAQSVEQFLQKNIATGYKLSEYDIKSQRLIDINNQIQLSLSVEMTLVKDGEEIVVLCPMILSH